MYGNVTLNSMMLVRFTPQGRVLLNVFRWVTVAAIGLLTGLVSVIVYVLSPCVLELYSAIQLLHARVSHYKLSTIIIDFPVQHTCR